MPAIRIGLISDTHDLLRPEALAALQGSDRILHAGDICTPGVLERLGLVAPVTAVRGNNDTGAWADRLERIACCEVGGLRVVMVHDLADLTPGERAGADVVVHGHSHRPSVEREAGVLRINPGSAGRRRFNLPVTAAELIVDEGKATARILPLVDSP